MIPRINCAHCNATGTCTNAGDRKACAYCAKKFKGPTGELPVGLVCRVCEGRGTVESFSLKLQNRFVPLFAGGFVVLLLIFLVCAYFFNEKNFDKLIGFAGTIIGTITGYYFGGKQSAEAIETNNQSDPQIEKSGMNEPADKNA